MTTVVERGGQPIAALVHDPALEENSELIDSVCAAAAMTLENERLQAELRARLGGATGLARPPGRRDRGRAQEDRARPSRRDTAAARVVRDVAGLARREAAAGSGAAEADRPGGASGAGGRARGAARAQPRDPPGGAHRARARRGARGARRSRGASRTLEVAIDERPCPAVEAAAYFVASEALTNAVKHSHAREVRISASRERDRLIIEVTDDGIGGAALQGGSGIRGLDGPRRGAGRDTRRLQPARTGNERCARSSHAGSRRRRRGDPPRGARAAADRGRLRGRRAWPATPRSCSSSSSSIARRRDGRHSHAPDPYRRGAARGEGDPRALAADRCPRPLPARPRELRARAALRRNRRGRIPAQGARIRSRRAGLERRADRQRRLRARSRCGGAARRSAQAQRRRRSST